MGRVLFGVFAVGLAVLIAFAVGGDAVGARLQDADMLSRLALSLGVLVLVSGGVLATWRQDVGVALRYGLIWVGIVAALWVVYTLMIAPRVMSIPPGAPLQSASISVSTPVDPTYPAGRAAALRKRDDGHFWAEAEINGTHVRLMVDTGASIVALTRQDALRLGLRSEDLVFDMRIATAGGERRGAFVLLEEVVVGRVRVPDVEAVVMDDALQQSLLGMSFLNRLSEWRSTPQAMIIRE
jgi:aspartyl protease family protein